MFTVKTLRVSHTCWASFCRWERLSGPSWLMMPGNSSCRPVQTQQCTHARREATFCLLVNTNALLVCEVPLTT